MKRLILIIALLAGLCSSAHAYPVQRDVAGLNSASSTFKIENLPANAHVGDFLLMNVSYGSTVGGTQEDFTTPSGWTLVQKNQSCSPRNINQYSKIATLSDIGGTVLLIYSGTGVPFSDTPASSMDRTFAYFDTAGATLSINTASSACNASGNLGTIAPTAAWQLAATFSIELFNPPATMAEWWDANTANFFEGWASSFQTPEPNAQIQNWYGYVVSRHVIVPVGETTQMSSFNINFTSVNVSVLFNAATAPTRDRRVRDVGTGSGITRNITITTGSTTAAVALSNNAHAGDKVLAVTCGVPGDTITDNSGTFTRELYDSTFSPMGVWYKVESASPAANYTFTATGPLGRHEITAALWSVFDQNGDVLVWLQGALSTTPASVTVKAPNLILQEQDGWGMDFAAVCAGDADFTTHNIAINQPRLNVIANLDTNSNQATVGSIGLLFPQFPQSTTHFTPPTTFDLTATGNTLGTTAALNWEAVSFELGVATGALAVAPPNVWITE